MGDIHYDHNQKQIGWNVVQSASSQALQLTNRIAYQKYQEHQQQDWLLEYLQNYKCCCNNERGKQFII